MDAATRARLHAVFARKGLFDRAREALREFAADVRRGASHGDVYEHLRVCALTQEVADALREEGIDPATLTQLAALGVRPTERAIAESAGGAAGSFERTAPGEYPPTGAHTHTHTLTRAYPQPEEEHGSLMQPGRRYLRISLQGGRAFLSHIDAEALEEVEAEAAESAETRDPRPRTQRFYVLHALCRGQRFTSELVRVKVDPEFRDTFLIDVTPSTARSGVLPPLKSLLHLENHLVHIVLCLVTQSPVPVRASRGMTAGTASELHGVSTALTEDVSLDIVATCALDWRHVLAKPDGVLETVVSMMTAGAGPHRTGMDGAPLPAGLLNLRVDLVPGPNAPGVAVPAATEAGAAPVTPNIDVRLASTTADIANATLLGTDAKAWWAEYKAVHPSHKRRYVRLYGTNERGEMQPVVTFVTPLVADRVLDSPFHAGRFVSLLPFRRQEPVLGGGPQRQAVWHPPHVTLAMRQGDVEDHATLLCSLLLGFGLEAYVAIGARADADGVETEHAWVIVRYAGDAADADTTTIAANSSTVRLASRAAFWEPLTGQRLAPGEIAPSGYKITRVACVFNHERFFANHALDDRVEATRWEWDDIAQWKAMEPAVLQALQHAPVVPLAPPALDARQLAITLEDTLKRGISSYRALHAAAQLGVRFPGSLEDYAPAAGETPWDSQLEYQLGTALHSYETERLAGFSPGGDEFASCVKRYVPRGSAFKGFPMMFNHISPGRIMETLMATPAAREILHLSTAEPGQIRFALRVHVHVYAEDTIATWIMLAVSYPV